MNIESKARSGFTSIMLRGGRMTKWKGQVASYAPQIGHLQSASVVAMAAALAFGGVASEGALAQDRVVEITTGAPAPAVNEVNSGTGALTILATVEIDGGGAYAAIDARNTATATNLTVEAVDVSSRGHGVFVINDGSGLTSVTTTGSVGADVDGINVSNGSNTTGLTVSTNNVAAGSTGIEVVNNGAGETIIESDGAVTGGVTGVKVSGGSASSNLLVTLNSSTGNGGFGVLTSNVGTGSTTITASGAINALEFADTDASVYYGGTGIRAINGDTSIDLSIDVADVTGTNAGIYAASSGSGSITISAENVSGSVDDGISAVNLLDAGGVARGNNISVAANSVTGGRYGIVTKNYGTGYSKVQTTGDVTSTTDDGVYVVNGVDATDLTIDVVNVTGGDILAGTGGNGVYGRNDGVGSTTITSLGLVTGVNGDGVRASGGVNTDNLTISANDVVGSEDGIHASNNGTGSTNVLLTGSATGGDRQDGIDAYNGASATSLTIQATDAAGIVEGGVNGILAVNNGSLDTIVNAAGIVEGGAQGINVTNALNAGDLTITATKLAVADASGVVAPTVSGGNFGILAVNNGAGGSTTITALGKTVGTTNDGISATNAVGTLNLIVTADAVEGGENGVTAINDGTGFTKVVTTGLVSGGLNGVEARNAASATSLEVTTAAVSGGEFGIIAVNQGTGSTTVIATGPVDGATEGGINAFNQTNAIDLSVTAVDVTGGTFGIFAQNNGSGSTTVTSTGLASGLNGEGIYAKNDASAVNLTVVAQDVSGTQNGIQTVNDGTGFTSITLNGIATGGTGFNGIAAVNAATAKDLTITATSAAGTIEGGLNGILAVNNGVGGSTTIDVKGAVTGTIGDGISATNVAGTLNLSVTAAAVDGALNGVTAINDGTGFTKVVTTGLVSGGLNGVEARNAATATSLEITTAAVSGGDFGIIAVNQGTGSTTVIATGPVDGATEGGINAVNQANAIDLSVTAVDVTGGTFGIFAQNNGSGSTTVTSTGLASGLNGEGIYAKNDASAVNLTVVAQDVSGTQNGIQTVNDGTGFTSITLNGTATGGTGFNGIAAVNAATAKDLTITATKVSPVAGGVAAATITGGLNGILAVNNSAGGSTIIDIKGKVVGQTENGIIVTNDVGTSNLSVTAADVDGAINGIDASNFGTGFTFVKSTGTVTADDTGIRVISGLGTDLTVDANIVTGQSFGIFASNNGSGSTLVKASGAVTGNTNSGINAVNQTAAADNLTVDAVDVTGVTFGIFAENNGSGATLVKSTGLVTGLGNDAINVKNSTVGTDVSVDAKDILSILGDGIDATNNGTGNTSIIVSGTVLASKGDGIIATNAASAKDLTITATKVSPVVAGAPVATITGSVNGINATNNGAGGSTTIDVKGKVVGQAGDGIIATNGVGTFNLSVTAVDVDGAIDGIDASNFGSGFTFVKSTGTVTADDTGIRVAGGLGTDVTVDANIVTGQSFGIFATNNGSGSTLVKASGAVTGNTNTGISAINLRAAADNLTVDAVDVTGVTFGIFALNDGSGATLVKSTGLVTGLGDDAIKVTSGAAGTDLTVDAKDILSILGDGIDATNNGTGNTSIIVSGTVLAGKGDGIIATNAASAKDLTITATKVSPVVDGVPVATITGSVNGINATNNGAGGSTTIDVKGKVIGKADDGINVTNGVGTFNLSVTAVDVDGAINGIDASNFGTGFTFVKSTGTVTAIDTGINARNGVTGTDVTVDANIVTGQSFGIFASNNGIGSTLVKASGAVTGNTNTGISAVNQTAAADNLTIEAVDVTGVTFGIFALNNGSGATLVKSTGLVTGLGDDAIKVTSGAAGTNLTVDAKDILSILGDGIDATNNGTGNTSIIVSGTVAAGKGDGIIATNAASAKDLTITATKVSPVVAGAPVATITGSVNGINATNNGAGGSTTIDVKGKVVGQAGDGIIATNETGTANLSISAVDVDGDRVGILALNYGTGATTVISTGTVTGGLGDGIVVAGYGAGDVTVRSLNVSGIEGIDVLNAGAGSSTFISSSGAVDGATGNGIYAFNDDLAKDLTVTTVDVTGEKNGIFVENEGTGSTTVTSTGLASGSTLDGIFAYNDVKALNVTISAKDAAGFDDGIEAINNGKGSTSITVTGNVAGGNTTVNDNYGIYAANAETAKDISIIASNPAGTISGAEGIGVKNAGTGGSTTIDVKGKVVGQSGDGISAYNNVGTLNLSVTAVDVEGADNGISAQNDGGTGETKVTALGTVIGTLGIGIEAENGVNSTNLIVSANKVTGGNVGIVATNIGSGFTQVTATGDVRGVDAGIFAVNGPKATDLTINATKVDGDEFGIVANNGGKGSTSITVNGAVTGTTEEGILAENGAVALNLTVNGKDVTGGKDGVRAINKGSGSTLVTLTGNVAGGVNEDGVDVSNAATAKDLTVTVKNATGGSDGLDVNNDGTGKTVVNVSGKVTGGTGIGIKTASKAGNLTTINLTDTADVSATSGNAIANNLGDSVLNVAKSAVITGTVRLADGSDTANFLFDNTAAFAKISVLDGGDNISAADGFIDVLNLNGAGTYDLVGARVINWETINLNAGTLRFSDAAITAGTFNINRTATLDGSNNLVATTNVNVSNGGTLLAGNAAGNANMRIVGNITNGGLVNLSGAAPKVGDKLNVSGNFTGAGGQTTLDTVVNADNSPTDLVIVNGNVNGTSLIAINNVGGVGGITVADGIKIVQVNGTSNADALELVGGDLQVGGFRYDLFLGGIADPNDQDWYLRSAGVADIAAEVIAVARLSDDISTTFLGTLHERVGEEEHLAKRGYQSGGVSGLWGRFIGKGFRDKLSSEDFGEVRSTGSITGMQLGLDFVRKINGGNTTIAGAYAGYADGSSSDRNIFQTISRQTGSSKANAVLAGLYGTHYNSTGWYANAVVQATFIDAAANAKNGITLETNGNTFLGSLEMGKALKLGGRMAFEPQLQVIYSQTNFDAALDSAGILNETNIEDSIIGRVGFRLKTTKDEKYNADGGLFSGYLKVNLWHNLLGADVNLVSAGQSLGKFEPKKTWVDAGLGTTLTVAKRTEIFFDADVEFGIDKKTTAGTGKVGLRFNW